MTAGKATGAGAQTGLYPIRTVAGLTGVNPITLRAWERRYGLVRPQRTAKGHRLYTPQDVARIRRVLALLNQGVAIGQVRPLIDDALTQRGSPPAAGPADAWKAYLARMRDAVEQFDETALDEAYHEALSLYPVDLVVRHLVNPLLEHLGHRWRQHPAGIAEEHFFSVYLRNKIGARLHHLKAPPTGPLLLLSCLPGEYHEAGMLFFALAAIGQGYRAILFGADLPLEQIPAILQRRRCDAVVLSGCGTPAPGLFELRLPALVTGIGIPVFVGGAVCLRHDTAIGAAGAIALGREFQPALRRIAGRLASRGKS